MSLVDGKNQKYFYFCKANEQKELWNFRTITKNADIIEGRSIGNFTTILKIGTTAGLLRRCSVPWLSGVLMYFLDVFSWSVFLPIAVGLIVFCLIGSAPAKSFIANNPKPERRSNELERKLEKFVRMDIARKYFYDSDYYNSQEYFDLYRKNGKRFAWNLLFIPAVVVAYILRGFFGWFEDTANYMFFLQWRY